MVKYWPSSSLRLRFSPTRLRSPLGIDPSSFFLSNIVEGEDVSEGKKIFSRASHLLRSRLDTEFNEAATTKVRAQRKNTKFCIPILTCLKGEKIKKLADIEFVLPTLVYWRTLAADLIV
ncbi:hypothetical protein OUZ56_023262 [Daphnia magna]|uniref:Uncharacterized protein n=1 Tax=Daphnia magna TaxID=35525 RepID=A0ABR0AZE2_9CRUS|nr:hypothetical protein OUZ56_023262 [Daphnia magna]